MTYKVCMNKLQKTLAVQAATMVLILVSVSNADAEIRTITATGEYRMGDNDTRTDAKRLALLDAKRLALEQAGTYIESITEVKNFDLSNEEIRAYTAGIVEMVEQATKDTMEGTTHVIRVDVTAKIDTDVVARQIDAVRQNENAKAELFKLRAESDQLRHLLDMQTHEIAALRSKAEVEASARERQKILTKTEVDELLARTWIEVAGAKGATLIAGKSSEEARARASQLVERALELDPSNAAAHETMGIILHEGKHYQAAIIEYRKALAAFGNTGPTEYLAGLHTLIGRALDEIGKVDEALNEYRSAVLLQPNNAEARASLGIALLNKDDEQGAIQELRVAVKLAPDRADFHELLGDAWLKVDLDAAIKEYRTAIRLKPNDANLHKFLGSALLGKGDRDGMISEYYMAARLKPAEAAMTFQQLGSALHHSGDRSGAIREYRKALELDPDREIAAWSLAYVLVELGNWPEAFQEVRQMKSKRASWEPFVYYEFGRHIEHIDRRASAWAYQSILSMTPKTPDTKWLIEAAQERLAALRQ